MKSLPIDRHYNLTSISDEQFLNGLVLDVFSGGITASAVTAGEDSWTDMTGCQVLMRLE